MKSTRALVGMDRKMEVVKIGALLGELFVKRNWQQNLDRNQLFEFWNGAVGKDIAAHAQPELLRGQVLWINVVDSIWMQQLHLMKEDIRQVINEKISGTGDIADIRFKLVSKLKPVLAKKVIEPVPAKKEPDPESVAEFERLISAINDDGVKDSFRKIWLNQHGRDKY